MEFKLHNPFSHPEFKAPDPVDPSQFPEKATLKGVEPAVTPASEVEQPVAPVVELPTPEAPAAEATEGPVESIGPDHQISA
jgi:hypothetical protein